MKLEVGTVLHVHDPAARAPEFFRGNGCERCVAEPYWRVKATVTKVDNTVDPPLFEVEWGWALDDKDAEEAGATRKFIFHTPDKKEWN